MRLVCQMLVAPLFGLLLSGSSARAQQPASPASPAPSSVPAASNSQENKENGSGLEVPVSLNRIREALAQPPPAEPLKGLNDQPTFRLEVQERQKFEQLMEKIKFDGGGGPEVFGGRANYDMQQLLFPRVDNPLVQPYGAFSTGEILTLAGEAVIEKLVATKISHLFTDVLRTQSEREAREEVARELAAFQAAQAAAPPKN